MCWVGKQMELLTSSLFHLRSQLKWEGPVSSHHSKEVFGIKNRDFTSPCFSIPWIPHHLTHAFPNKGMTDGIWAQLLWFSPLKEEPRWRMHNYLPCGKVCAPGLNIRAKLCSSMSWIEQNHISFSFEILYLIPIHLQILLPARNPVSPSRWYLEI